MADFPKYTCSCCGKVHEEWPALTYTSPTAYNTLSEEEKELIAKGKEIFNKALTHVHMPSARAEKESDEEESAVTGKKTIPDE